MATHGSAPAGVCAVQTKMLNKGNLRARGKATTLTRNPSGPYFPPYAWGLAAYLAFEMIEKRREKKNYNPVINKKHL